MPGIEDVVDDAAGYFEVLHKLNFDGINENEYRHRIRFALLMAADTLGDDAFLSLSTHFSPELVMSSAVTLEQAVNHNALDTQFAFPCLLNLISDLTLTLKPSDPNEGMAQALDLVDLGEETRTFILGAYSVVPPTIH